MELEVALKILAGWFKFGSVILLYQLAGSTSRNVYIDYYYHLQEFTNTRYTP